MPTIHRGAGWKIQIFANDHRPPHVHVVSAEHAIQIAIADGYVLHGRRRAIRALSDARRWVDENRDWLQREWNRIAERASDD